MAVYAAHLTRTLQGTPSVFQVTAQEALGATVKPALSKLIDYLAAVYPNKFGWCQRWYDELYLLFDCCLQYHYLKHYAASFSESFYGLLRVPIHVSNEFSSGERLSDFLEKGSLLLLVLAPYLRDKVEALVQRWREDEQDGRLSKSNTDKLRRAAIKFYSVLHLSIEMVKLVQLGLYLTGRNRSPTPALSVLGLTLRDAPPKQDPDHTWRDSLYALFTGQIGQVVVTFPMVGSAALRCVEYGAFAVQFLRWWEAVGTRSPQALPLPDAPQKEERTLRWKNKCPVCLRTWKTPTVLPVSGYVFCYICISRHIRSHNTCPVTRLPATEHQLVRMYIDD